MTKQLAYESTFDGPVGAVLALLTDKKFLEAYAAELGATRSEATVERGPTETTTRLNWTVPTDGVPGFIKKLIGNEVDMVQQMTWTAAADGGLAEFAPSARVLLDVKAAKDGRMSGDAQLTAIGAQTRFTLKGGVKVDVPVVGGKIEGLARDLIIEALDDQTTLGNRWLADGYGALPPEPHGA